VVTTAGRGADCKRYSPSDAESLTYPPRKCIRDSVTPVMLNGEGGPISLRIPPETRLSGWTSQLRQLDKCGATQRSSCTNGRGGTGETDCFHFVSKNECSRGRNLSGSAKCLVPCGRVHHRARVSRDQAQDILNHLRHLTGRLLRRKMPNC
jgi:hypothetical protein